MKDLLVKNLHVMIILYAVYNLFTIYETNTETIEEKQQAFQNVEARYNVSKRALKEVDKFNRDLEASKLKVKSVVMEIARVQKQLPSENNDTEVSKIMSDYSNDLKLLDHQVSIEPEVSKDFYFSKKYRYKARGTFLQFLVLFEKLETLAKTGRILNATNFSFKEDSQFDSRSRFKTLELTATLESFRYNANYKAADI